MMLLITVPNFLVYKYNLTTVYLNKTLLQKSIVSFFFGICIYLYLELFVLIDALAFNDLRQSRLQL